MPLSLIALGYLLFIYVVNYENEIEDEEFVFGLCLVRLCFNQFRSTVPFAEPIFGLSISSVMMFQNHRHSNKNST